jgi:hypothetical protein
MMRINRRYAAIGGVIAWSTLIVAGQAAAPPDPKVDQYKKDLSPTKGVTAGAKVQAMTALDLMMRPELVSQAWDYFRTCRPKSASTRSCAPRTSPRSTVR